jgi:hypothetical protein
MVSAVPPAAAMAAAAMTTATAAMTTATAEAMASAAAAMTTATAEAMASAAAEAPTAAAAKASAAAATTTTAPAIPAIAATPAVTLPKRIAAPVPTRTMPAIIVKAVVAATEKELRLFDWGLNCPDAVAGDSVHYGGVRWIRQRQREAGHKGQRTHKSVYHFVSSSGGLPIHTRPDSP